MPPVAAIVPPLDLDWVISDATTSMPFAEIVDFLPESFLSIFAVVAFWTTFTPTFAAAAAVPEPEIAAATGITSIVSSVVDWTVNLPSVVTFEPFICERLLLDKTFDKTFAPIVATPELEPAPTKVIPWIELS